jgi:hypothetical protein
MQVGRGASPPPGGGSGTGNQEKTQMRVPSGARACAPPSETAHILYPRRPHSRPDWLGVAQACQVHAPRGLSGRWPSRCRRCWCWKRRRRAGVIRTSCRCPVLAVPFLHPSIWRKGHQRLLESASGLKKCERAELKKGKMAEQVAACTDVHPRTYQPPLWGRFTPCKPTLHSQFGSSRCTQVFFCLPTSLATP